MSATQFLIGQLRQYAPACKTLISASAIGYYGPDHVGAEPFTESSPPCSDFLADTCRQWEEAALNAAGFMRTVILRFGIVMGRESGAFPKFAQPLSFGIMPILGGGSQVVSWIEVHDLAKLIVYALENARLSGIYNAVAPNFGYLPAASKNNRCCEGRSKNTGACACRVAEISTGGNEY